MVMNISENSLGNGREGSKLKRKSHDRQTGMGNYGEVGEGGHDVSGW